MSEINYASIQNTTDFKEVVHQSAIPYLMINKKGLISDANKAIGDILGYSHEDLIGTRFDIILNDLSITDQNGEMISEGMTGECTGIHEDNSLKFFQYNSIPYKAKNSELFTSIILTDISRLKKAEREMTLLINNTTESFLRLNKELQIISFNRQFIIEYKRYYGIDVEPGHFIMDYVLPERKEALKAIYQKVLRGSTEETQLVIDTKEGALTYQVRYRPVRNESNEIEGVFVSAFQITTQVNALKKTEESELRYRKLFNENPVPAWILDVETFRFLKVNSKALLQYGYTREEFHKMTIFDLWKLSKEKNEEQIKSITSRESGNFTGVRNHHLKNGNIITVEITSVGVDFKKRKCLLVMAVDITERINAERKKEFEKQHREALINSSNDHIWSISPDFKLIAANNSFLDLLKKETNITYKPGDDLMYLHPYTSNFLQLWKEDFDRAITGEYIFTQKYIPANDNYPALWLEIKCSPIFENKVVAGVACYSRNITDRKIAEEQLKESEANLAEAQRLAKLGNWHRDLKTGKLTWSKELYNITGMDDDAIIADKDMILQYIDEKDREMVVANGEKIRKTGEPYTIIYHAITPRGERKVIKENGYGVKDPEGNVISLFGTAQDITESHLTEEAIKKALDEKETILESIGDGFFATDKNWIVTYWNEKAGIMLGKTKEEMIGKNLWSIFSDQLHTRSYIKYHTAIKSNQVIHFEDYYDSVNKWYEIGAYPSDNGLSVYFKDITSRKIAEENVRVNNERYNLVAQATNDSIWDLDIVAGKLTRTGGGFKLLFGYENHFAPDLEYVQNHQVHPDDSERIKSSRLKAFNDSNESYWEEEYRFLKADGSYAYVNDRGFIIRDDEGKAIRMIGATQDITKQKEHVKEITRIKQNMEALINTTSDIIWSVDTDFKIITANKAYINQINTVSDKIVKEGEDILQHVAGIEINNHWKTLYEKAFSGEKFTTEEKIFYPDESDYRYQMVTFSPIKNKNTKVVGVACFSKDITDMKRSANLLKKSEKRFSELFQMSPQPMWLYEQDSFRFAEVNQAMVKHYGYSQAELLHMTIMDIRPPEDVMKTKELIERRKWKKEEIYHETFRHFKKNGELIYVQIYSTPIMVNDKNYTMVIAIDVTQQLHHEQQITRAIINAQENERYEVGGELHDNVCQLLATSKMSLGMLKKAITPQNQPMLAQSQEYITMALDEIRNISHRLAPTFFSDKTLEEAFIKLFKNFNAEDKYNIVLDFHEGIQQQPISKELQLNLYRILQEQLRNISKYAAATVIEVDVLVMYGKIKMRIADNGKGFEPDRVSDGIGIGNMKRRTRLFNGTFEIITSPGNGCEVVVTIPL